LPGSELGDPNVGTDAILKMPERAFRKTLDDSGDDIGGSGMGGEIHNGGVMLYRLDHICERHEHVKPGSLAVGIDG